jgi:hypothetical protein
MKCIQQKSPPQYRKTYKDHKTLLYGLKNKGGGLLVISRST